MKKVFAAVLSIILVMGCISGCGSSSQEKQASDTSDVKQTSSDKAKKDTFTVGFDQDFPPYGYVDDDGNYTGFDLEMAAEVAKRLDLELVLQPVDWDAKDMELSSGAIDCIWNGFTINGREDEYEWSKAYMDNSQVIVVMSDSGIKSYDDLKGKVVTVQTDSAAQDALDSEEHTDLKASFADLVVCADYNSAFMDLESGAVDAIAMDIGVANYQIDSRDDSDSYKVLDEKLTSEQYGIGFLKGNTQLRDKIETTLEEMVKDGTFAKISEKWFGYDVCTIKL